jgi:hypothetical protein
MDDRQAAVSGYLKSFVDVATSVGERSLSVRPSAVVCAEFLEVLSSAGRIESIAFADAVYLLLETLLKSVRFCGCDRGGVRHCRCYTAAASIRAVAVCLSPSLSPSVVFAASLPLLLSLCHTLYHSSRPI